jgi:hypothetical protein
LQQRKEISLEQQILPIKLNRFLAACILELEKHIKLIKNIKNKIAKKYFLMFITKKLDFIDYVPFKV